MAETYLDLFFGYAAIWVIIGCFLGILMREQKALEKRCEELESRTIGSERVQNEAQCS